LTFYFFKVKPLKIFFTFKVVLPDEDLSDGIFAGPQRAENLGTTAIKSSSLGHVILLVNLHRPKTYPGDI
jgi:hypothetical protein